MNILLTDDSSNFVAGKPSALNDIAKLPVVSVTTVVRAYNENQVAADQKYFKKKLHISGVIAGINSGILNEPYLTFHGSNSLELPQAHFSNADIQKIASLKRGQKISLVCMGGGVVIGTPMFMSCQFAQDYAEKILNEMTLEIHNFLSGKKLTSKDLAGMSIATIALARFLSLESACFANNVTECLKEIRSITKGNFSKERLTKIVFELKALGVLVPALRT